MMRINIENTTGAKALIEFCLSHRDDVRVLIFVYHNKQIMAKICTYR